MSTTTPDWSDGYVVDVAYVHNFHPGLTPVNLAFAALSAGVRPPDIDAPFAYLDLGCGNGFTPALIAAACPQADVWANDFNPVHIRNTPAARETLDVLRRADRAYIAHEFLNECWSLFHPGEVAAELAPAGLRYVGPARMIDGLDCFWLSDDQRALLAEAPDTAARESLRDLILDRRFRHDLFVREGDQTEPVTTEPVTAASWFAERRYALANLRADCALALTVRGRETLLPTTPFAALLDALAVRPETGRALAGLPGVAGIAPSEIFEALGILIAMGHVQPALPERDQIARRQSTDRFNAAALEAARMGNPLAALASPVTGSGIGVSGSEQLLIDALQSGIPMDMLSITDADGVDIATRFRDHSMPRLEMLGIL